MAFLPSLALASLEKVQSLPALLQMLRLLCPLASIIVFSQHARPAPKDLLGLCQLLQGSLAPALLEKVL
jgi:hypothetical protein